MIKAQWARSCMIVLCFVDAGQPGQQQQQQQQQQQEVVDTAVKPSTEQQIEQQGVHCPQQNRQQQQQQQQQQTASTQAYRSKAVGKHKFEYLDHTADVQLHAWGSSLAEAFEQAGLAMFNYMTPIDDLQVHQACSRDVSVSGHDLQSLLFAFLDELLFIYSTEYIMMKFIAVTSLDTEDFTVTATGRGEKFDQSRHECGTEVKAVTYSAMLIRQQPGDAEVFVIVDI
ncbi:hypothetical protein OEZ86_005848 [Tetradesmus obliquus]|nr:hypothetical protein OEZ86_005848 [Tetradesmus obliquus]